MSVIFDGEPYSVQNKSMSGIRLLLNRKIGANWSGYRHIGNILSPDLEQGIERYKHFASAIGQDKLDFIAPIKAEPIFKFSTDEFSNANLKLFMNANDPVAVQANAAATHPPETFIAGLTGELAGLSESNLTDAQRTALTVYDVAGAALLVKDTDYAIEAILGETMIKMLVDTNAGKLLRVGNGNTATTAYGFQQRAALILTPLTNPVCFVQAKIQFFPVVGRGGEWRVNNAMITNGSKFAPSKKELNAMDFELNLIDDSVANPTKPLGQWYDYGANDTGAPTI